MYHFAFLPAVYEGPNFPPSLPTFTIICLVGYIHPSGCGGFPGSASGKESTCQCKRLQERQVQSLGWEDPLEKEMATHSSTLAWKIP